MNLTSCCFQITVIMSPPHLVSLGPRHSSIQCLLRRSASLPVSTITNQGISPLATSPTPAHQARTTVFYDGMCGLCSKEINHYKRIAPAGMFHWQDLTLSAEELEKEGVSLADGLRLLHVRDEAGRLHIGVDAFILIWSQLRRWRLLAGIVSIPPVRRVAQAVYVAFADRRFNSLQHCQVAAGKKT